MTRWLWPLVSALGDTCRQTCKFKTSLVYTASSRTSRAIEGPDLKKPKERKKRKENCHSSCPLTICMHLSILRSTVYKHTHTHTQQHFKKYGYVGTSNQDFSGQMLKVYSPNEDFFDCIRDTMLNPSSRSKVLITQMFGETSYLHRPYKRTQKATCDPIILC